MVGQGRKSRIPEGAVYTNMVGQGRKSRIPEGAAYTNIDGLGLLFPSVEGDDDDEENQDPRIRGKGKNKAKIAANYSPPAPVLDPERYKGHFVDETLDEIDVRLFGPLSKSTLPGWNADVYLEDRTNPNGATDEAYKICMSPGRGCIVRIDFLEKAWRQFGGQAKVDVFADKSVPLEEAKRTGLEVLFRVCGENYDPSSSKNPQSTDRNFTCFGESYVPFRMPIFAPDGGEFYLPVKLKCLVVNDDYPLFPWGKPGDREVGMWIGHEVSEDRVYTDMPSLWTADGSDFAVSSRTGPQGRNRFGTLPVDLLGSWLVRCNNWYDEQGNFIAEGKTLDIKLSEDEGLLTNPDWW